MRKLRQSKAIARWVLLWFSLFIGSSVATTLLVPEKSALVCTAGSGVKLVSLSSDGQESTPVGLHCPLCLPLLAMPPADFSPFVETQAPAVQSASILYADPTLWRPADGTPRGPPSCV